MNLARLAHVLTRDHGAHELRRCGVHGLHDVELGHARAAHHHSRARVGARPVHAPRPGENFDLLLVTFRRDVANTLHQVARDCVWRQDGTQAFVRIEHV